MNNKSHRPRGNSYTSSVSSTYPSSLKSRYVLLFFSFVLLLAGFGLLLRVALKPNDSEKTPPGGVVNFEKNQQAEFSNNLQQFNQPAQ